MLKQPHSIETKKDGQQGSIIVPMVGVIFVALVLLGSVHLGYLFYMKREMQNAADSAAQAGALELALNGCSAAQTLANNHVKRAMGEISTLVECGSWDDRAENAELAFTTPTTNPNAVRVQLTQEYAPTVPFMDKTTLFAEAIAAQGGGVATFSVGPQLLSLNTNNNGLLPLMLRGIGLDPNINVLNYEGIANVHLTPTGLLKELLGIEVPADITLGSLHTLLKSDLGAKIAFIDILNASIHLIESQGISQPINEQVLSALRNSLNAMPSNETLIDLFGSESGQYPHLFSIAKLETSPEDNNYNQLAGLGAQINLEQILGLGLALAARDKALGLEVDLSHSPLNSIVSTNIKVGIIEPPTIAIGGIGTQAHSANIRIFIHLCLGLGSCNQPDSSSRFLDLKLDLPIVLEVMNATGTLQKVCTPTSGASLADIAVQSEVAGICIGNFGFDAGAGQTHPFSYQNSCTDLITTSPNQLKKQILDVNVLGLLNLELNEALAVPALANHEPLPIASFTNPDLPQTIAVDTQPLSNIGSTVQHLLDVILAQLLGGLLQSPSLNNNPSGITADLVQKEYWPKAVESANCNATAEGLSGRNCRRNALNEALTLIKNDMENLGERLTLLQDKTVLGALGGTLGSLLTLDLVGVVGGLLNTVGNLLSGVLGLIGLPTESSQCIGTSVLGIPTSFGTEAGCISYLESTINAQNSAGNPPLQILNIVISLLDLLGIWDILDLLGTVLEELLQSITGIKLGTVDTTLYHIDCKPTVRLVY